MNDPLIGTQLGNYRVERVIGRGGMATVYHGWDVSLERPVAIKVVDARHRDNPAYTQRFVQEARTVATWRHDNILQVFYAGQEDELPYFVMEYVDGPDLGDVMRRYADDGELMPQEDVLRLGRSIAAALDYAHERQIIHRDVKPANVMVAKDGRVVLADFGLALNTQQGSIGEIFGTPHYIAPEQAHNSATAVPQSDLYALGVILYEMLTGVVPFDDPSPTSLALQHITQPPSPPRELNPRLNKKTEAVLIKALSKQPDDRFQSGKELMAALAKTLERGTTAVPDSDLPPLPTGVAAPALSRVSVAQRVSFFLPPPPSRPSASAPMGGGFPTPPAPKPVQPPLPTPPAPKPVQPLPPMPPTPRPVQPLPPPAVAGKELDKEPGKKPLWGLIAVAAVVLLILFFGGRSLFGGGESESTPSPTLTNEALAAAPTTVPDTAEPVQPTQETEPAEMVETAVVPETAEPTATVEPAVTETPPIASTETPIPPTESASASPTPDAVPTVLYPDGHRLELHYNPSSFYVFNASSERVRISNMIFEALNSDGQPVGYSFDGYRWSEFYSFAASNGCVRLEAQKMSDYLRPPKCREYNSTVTPPEGDPQHFWVERSDVVQYRVLWGGQEIARCPIPGDFCEVYTP